MNDTLHPLRFQWDGESMIPLNPRAADWQYVVGEVYNLDHREDRSLASHGHYFIALQEAWETLPERQSERFATAEHLRKYALIATGYRDERSIVCSSKAEAQRIAAFIRPMDDFAVVSVSESVVLVLTAKSQSYRAMGKAAFQKSKDDVLGYVANLLGTTAGELEKVA